MVSPDNWHHRKVILVSSLNKTYRETYLDHFFCTLVLSLSSMHEWFQNHNMSRLSSNRTLISKLRWISIHIWISKTLLKYINESNKQRISTQHCQGVQAKTWKNLVQILLLSASWKPSDLLKIKYHQLFFYSKVCFYSLNSGYQNSLLSWVVKITDLS